MWPEQRGITVAQAIRFGKCAARFAAVSTIPTAKTSKILPAGLAGSGRGMMRRASAEGRNGR
jgi:hypothetical protein